jgi:hypothetical protein
MDQDKRRHRKLKRDIKRAGTRKLRRQLKRELTDHRENAAETFFDYGRNSSATLNGNDHDSTRRRSNLTAEPEDDGV